MAGRRRPKYELPPEPAHELPQGEELISSEAELEAEGLLGLDLDYLISLIDNIQENPKWFTEEDDEPFYSGGTASPSKGSQPWSENKRFDFFGKLSEYPEIMMELAKHLRIRQLMSLYSISKDFHTIINGHLIHNMLRCAEYRAPESAQIYRYQLYRPLCVPDPVGRPREDDPDEVRLVPGLKWLQMVYHRERAVRDILAFLARQGHRTPKGMSLSVKKMWFTMDIATSKRRGQLMHNDKFWTDVDLYNIQFFFVKLEMRFNDPINGPGDDGLRRLLLGQRGLSVMWRVFRREKLKSPLDLVKMAIRYFYYREPNKQALPLFGIQPEEISIGHLEGWGKGRIHLYRPDELIMRESVRRNLKLSTHLRDMLLWGYVNPDTHENIVPSAEEMYISDDDEEEGGKKWSDVEATEWKEPPMQKDTVEWMEKRKKAKKEEEGEDDEWSTDHEYEEADKVEDGDIEMKMGYEEKSDEIDYEVDDHGRLINPSPS